MIAWIVFGNGMREDATHKSTHLDPVLGEDAPRSRVRRGHTCQERTHLDPVSGDLEDTPRSWPEEDPSILAGRGPRSWSGEDTPRSWSGEDTSRILARRGCTSILCQHGREPNSM